MVGAEPSIDTNALYKMKRSLRLIPVFKCVKTVSHRGHREHRGHNDFSVFSVPSVAIHLYENRCNQIEDAIIGRRAKPYPPEPTNTNPAQ
jgi:hypothetical protein